MSTGKQINAGWYGMAKDVVATPVVLVSTRSVAHPESDDLKIGELVRK